MGCKSSLPKGDVTIAGGKSFTSYDYVCPFCHKPANPAEASREASVPLPAEGQDVLIRNGDAALFPTE
jgi:hypothetical protein